MIYYYGPISIGVIINLTLSIMSARHIYVESKRNERDLNSAGNQKNLTNQAQYIYINDIVFCLIVFIFIPFFRFSMFFQLFAITGGIWLFDILAYLFQINNKTITLIADVITSGQGVFLFIVTICKKEIFKSLYER